VPQGREGREGAVAVRVALVEDNRVFLTASASVLEMEALTEAGAAACLTKDEELDDIVAAIRDAAAR